MNFEPLLKSFLGRSLLLIATLLLCLSLVGCGSGKISPRATEYATAIYTATNLQKSEKIEAIRQMIETDIEQGEISTRDADHLRSILDQAEAGKWEKAMQSARTLMENQTQR